jgi:hypothetical protein
MVEPIGKSTAPKTPLRAPGIISFGTFTSPNIWSPLPLTVCAEENVSPETRNGSPRSWMLLADPVLINVMLESAGGTPSGDQLSGLDQSPSPPPPSQTVPADDGAHRPPTSAAQNVTAINRMTSPQALLSPKWRNAKAV